MLAGPTARSTRAHDDVGRGEIALPPSISGSLAAWFTSWSKATKIREATW